MLYPYLGIIFSLHKTERERDAFEADPSLFTYFAMLHCYCLRFGGFWGELSLCTRKNAPFTEFLRALNISDKKRNIQDFSILAKLMGPFVLLILKVFHLLKIVIRQWMNHQGSPKCIFYGKPCCLQRQQCPRLGLDKLIASYR